MQKLSGMSRGMMMTRDFPGTAAAKKMCVDLLACMHDAWDSSHLQFIIVIRLKSLHTQQTFANIVNPRKSNSKLHRGFFYSTSTKIRNFPLVVVFSPQLKHGGKRRNWHKRLKKVLSTSPFKCKRVSRAKERREKKETKKREKMSRCGNLLFCHSAYFSHHHQRSQVQQEPF